MLREDDLALELYERAVAAQHPRPSGLYGARAYLFEEHNRFPEALQAWNDAIACDPSNATLLESRGKYFLRRNDRERGRADFESVSRNAGAAGERLLFFVFLVLTISAHGFVLLAHLARENHALDEAERLLEEAVAVYPRAELSETRLFLAELCSRNGHFEQARLFLCC